MPNSASAPWFGRRTFACDQQVEAATLYADAAERWHKFGNVPQRDYALLGQGAA